MVTGLAQFPLLHPAHQARSRLAVFIDRCQTVATDLSELPSTERRARLQWMIEALPRGPTTLEQAVAKGVLIGLLAGLPHAAVSDFSHSTVDGQAQFATLIEVFLRDLDRNFRIVHGVTPKRYRP